MTIGFVAVPSFSSLTAVERPDSRPAYRHVAWRAKQARLGAGDEVVETVLMEDLDEAHDERVQSEIMDSGLEREESASMDGGRHCY